MSKAARWEPNLKDLKFPKEIDFDEDIEDLSKDEVRGRRDHRHKKRDQEKKDRKADSWN